MWASSAGSMRWRWHAARALACGVAIGWMGLLSSCGGGGGGGDGGGDEITVSMTTAGGATALAAGSTLTVRAQVMNATNLNVTWSLTGTTCPAACGTITATGSDTANYQAPVGVTAPFQVTVTARSVQDGTKSGAVVLTVSASPVCPANSGLLNGTYALLLQGFGTTARNGFAMVGSFTADGCGGISGGALDYGPSPSGAAVATSGSYRIGNDRRGTLDLVISGTSRSFAIALGQVGGGIAARGGVTDAGHGTTGALADIGRLSGTLWRQDPSAFSLSAIAGHYAYLLNGWTAGGGPRKAVGGTVALASSGSFTNGLQDEHTFQGAKTLGVAWNGSAGAPAVTNGRAVFSAGAFGANGSAVAYVINGGRMLALVVDASGTVLSGSLARQNGTFGPGSLQGVVVTIQTANDTQAGRPTQTMSVLSEFAADGASPQGTLSSHALDVNRGGTIESFLSPGASQYTYTVATSGQVMVRYGSIEAGKYYLTGPNTGFLLGLDAGVSIGEMWPQSGAPFNAASFSGSYFGSQAAGGSFHSQVASGVATSSGNGTLAATLDISVGGVLTARTDSLGGALAGSIGSRFTDARGNVIYIVSRNRFAVMSASASEVHPVVQVFEQ